MRVHMRESGRIHPVGEALRLQARYLSSSHPYLGTHPVSEALRRTAILIVAIVILLWLCSLPLTRVWSTSGGSVRRNPSRPRTGACGHSAPSSTSTATATRIRIASWH